MWPILLFVFLICVLINYVDGGGNFVFISRVVETVNSIREPTPREVREDHYTLSSEYKFGKRLYGFMMIKKPPLKWKSATAIKNGKRKDVTALIEYWAGPFRSFYGMPLKPVHFNTTWDSLEFTFADGRVIDIPANKSILLGFKEGQTKPL